MLYIWRVCRWQPTQRLLCSNANKNSHLCGDSQHYEADLSAVAGHDENEPTIQKLHSAKTLGQGAMLLASQSQTLELPGINLMQNAPTYVEGAACMDPLLIRGG